MKRLLALCSALVIVTSSPAALQCELSFPSAPESALENFPVLVRLKENVPGGFSYADCPDGATLWFTDSNGAILPLEIDTWNVDGESLVWVCVPEFSKNAKISMRWAEGGEQVAPELPDASEVWKRAGYNAVWHFSGSAHESVNGLVGAIVRGNPVYDGNADFQGPLGKTLWLDGNSHLRYAPQPAWASLGGSEDDPELTFSSWVRFDGSKDAGNTRMISSKSSWSEDKGFEMTLQGSFNKITVGLAGSIQLQTSIDKGANEEWKYFTASCSGRKVGFYTDGEIKNSAEYNKTILAMSDKELMFGATGGGSHHNSMTGGLDEIRIRAAASTPEWVAAEYATMTRSDYVSFGETEEFVPFDFSKISVSSVSATRATILTTLNGIGGGAGSAEVKLTVCGLGKTYEYQVGTATGKADVEFELDDLQPGAEWEVYFTAVNDSSPVATIKSASVTFETSSDARHFTPGLYQACIADQNDESKLSYSAAAEWDIAEASGGTVTLGPVALQSSGEKKEVWTSTDGTAFMWGNYTVYGYSGYMFMEGGKYYWFGASIDDRGYVWVDDGTDGWDASKWGRVQFGCWATWNCSGPYYISESGYYRIVFSAWNGTGGAGAEPANGNVAFPQLRFAALDDDGKPGQRDENIWRSAVDPGDGSLFVADKPMRTVSVASLVRKGMRVLANVEVGEIDPGEEGVLKCVYGSGNGGDNPEDWEYGTIISSSLSADAETIECKVEIKPDTRFVRYYVQYGNLISWSATQSLAWADTLAPDGFNVFIR